MNPRASTHQPGITFPTNAAQALNVERVQFAAVDEHASVAVGGVWVQRTAEIESGDSDAGLRAAFHTPRAAHTVVPVVPVGHAHSVRLLDGLKLLVAQSHAFMNTEAEMALRRSATPMTSWSTRPSLPIGTPLRNIGTPRMVRTSSASPDPIVNLNSGSALMSSI